MIAAPSDDLVHFATLVTPETIEAEEQRLDVRDAAEPIAFAILERAYWRWADRACPHPPRSAAAKQWLATASFVYRGIAYQGTRESVESNSGKGRRWWTEYHGADGNSSSDGRAHRVAAMLKHRVSYSVPGTEPERSSDGPRSAPCRVGTENRLVAS